MFLSCTGGLDFCTVPLDHFDFVIYVFVLVGWDEDVYVHAKYSDQTVEVRASASSTYGRVWNVA